MRNFGFSKIKSLFAEAIVGHDHSRAFVSVRFQAGFGGSILRLCSEIARSVDWHTTTIAVAMATEPWPRTATAATNTVLKVAVGGTRSWILLGLAGQPDLGCFYSTSE
jgi:hypothetical protein